MTPNARRKAEEVVRIITSMDAEHPYFPRAVIHVAQALEEYGDSEYWKGFGEGQLDDEHGYPAGAREMRERAAKEIEDWWCDPTEFVKKMADKVRSLPLNEPTANGTESQTKLLPDCDCKGPGLPHIHGDNAQRDK